MKAREIRKLERARQHKEIKQYSQRIDRAFSRLSEGCSNRVLRATSLGSLRDKKEKEAPQKTNRLYYSKPAREMGVTCTGRQKQRG
ncbi:transcriptional regulator, partial [Salmonella enterica subsp. enterica serovar Worthington]|nr:transcriptional regulator [Salmonella enterica subsp. enterica serovar Worthington]EDU3649776.1 transcriptional regulator [Salmonella enterica subsp. enterica serovar Worthington]